MIIKKCYTDYVRHIIRFYSRYLGKTHFRNNIERANWYACHTALESYSDRDKDILVYVYGAPDTLGDNVYIMANKYRINQNIIWDMMREFELNVAIERGLWYGNQYEVD